MRRVSASRLTRFASDVLAAAGLQADHAAAVAEVLVWADLRGVESHGVSRLPLYLRWLASGEMNTSAVVEAVLDRPALCLLEAHRAPGPVAMREAIERAGRMAAACGVATILVRGTTHTGALGYYTAHLAQAGFVALALAASGPLMGYIGAAAAAVSSAPLSMAAPRPDARPLVFDMASSAIPVGRLALAKASGEPLPPGTAMDASGRPTQDPHCAVAPLPAAGAKGAGLALMAEVLCSVMAAAPILAEALAPGAGPQPHRQNALLLAFDPSAIQSPARLLEEMEHLATCIHGLPRAEGVPEVLLPGERGWREFELRSHAGIPLSSAVGAQLERLAAEAGLIVPWA